MNSLILLITFALSGSDMVNSVLAKNSTLDYATAWNIAMIVEHESKRVGVSSEVLKSILMIESGYKLDAVRGVGEDFGIGQINVSNVISMNIDPMRLLIDLKYSIGKSAEVYAWFDNRYGRSESIKRYNCGTRRRCIKWKSARTYLRLFYKYYDESYERVNM